jgi:hypothetical protein
LRRCHSLVHGLMTRRGGLHRGSLHCWWSDSNLLSASGRSLCGWTSGRWLHWLLLLDYLSWVKCGWATTHASWRLGTSRRKWSWHGRSQIWKRAALWSLTIRVLQCWTSWSYRSWSQAHCCRGWTRLWSLPLRCACLGGLLLLLGSRGRGCGIHLALSQRGSSLG